jgi:hypothetical protein
LEIGLPLVIKDSELSFKLGIKPSEPASDETTRFIAWLPTYLLFFYQKQKVGQKQIDTRMYWAMSFGFGILQSFRKLWLLPKVHEENKGHCVDELLMSTPPSLKEKAANKPKLF